MLSVEKNFVSYSQSSQGKPGDTPHSVYIQRIKAVHPSLHAPHCVHQPHNEAPFTVSVKSERGVRCLSSVQRDPEHYDVSQHHLELHFLHSPGQLRAGHTGPCG